MIQRYWPAVGGAELLMGEISERLAADGHEVTVATSDAHDFELFWRPAARRFAEREAWHHGVRILRFPVCYLPFPGITYPGVRRLLWLLSYASPAPVSLLSRIARWTPRMPDMWKYLRDTNDEYDIVGGMTITFEPLLDAGIRFARRRRMPSVVYPLTHLGAGSAPARDALSRFYTMRHQVALVRSADAVVAQTKGESDFYVGRGVDPGRVLAVGPGFSPEDVAGGVGERFRVQHGLVHPIVFMLTKLSYDKGAMHTVAAMQRLWAQGSLAHLVLAGDVLEPFARFYDRLPEHTKARISLLGSVDEETKRDLFAAGDVFVMPSRTDSFGIVYLEAWAYAKPVIGARTWGVMDVIADGKDGLLVPFGDVSSLASAIDRLIIHPDEARAMGSAGRAKALQEHTWDAKYPKIRDLYLALGQARR